MQHSDGILLLKKFSVVIVIGLLIFGACAANFVKVMMDQSWGRYSEGPFAEQMPIARPVKDKRFLPFCQDGAVNRWMGCSL